ncbi:TIGR02594 family protein [Mesorhizobium sp. M0983]|uniref:NlpC/P60 family protein n=1 Tax=Mesorhizobium sp. M0983 TaxID=2957040 RepID=UPI00333A6E44
MKIIQIQQRLAELGYRPGPLDGAWGRQTMAAVRAFQAKMDLEPDAVVGPLTLAALFPNQATESGLDQPSIVWFKEALRLLGTRENPATGSNPDIIDWATDVNVMYKNDDIPWCGLFVGHCIASTLEREPLPTNVLSARAWARFGISTSPTAGAVMVFWRRSIQSGLGHVGFYAGEDETAYRILGGNQSDSVSLAWVSKERLVCARWPTTVPPTMSNALRANRVDQLSWNEA